MQKRFNINLILESRESVSIEEINELQQEINNDTAELHRKMEIHTVLEDLEQIASTIDTPTPREVALFQTAANLAVIGTDEEASNMLPAMEAFKPLAIEGFADKVKESIKKIIQYFKDLWNKFKEWFKKFFNFSKNKEDANEKQAEILRKKMKEADDEAEIKRMDEMFKQFADSLDSTVDSFTSSKQFEQAAKKVNEQLQKNQEELNKVLKKSDQETLLKEHVPIKPTSFDDLQNKIKQHNDRQEKLNDEINSLFAEDKKIYEKSTHEFKHSLTEILKIKDKVFKFSEVREFTKQLETTEENYTHLFGEFFDIIEKRSEREDVTPERIKDLVDNTNELFNKIDHVPSGFSLDITGSNEFTTLTNLKPKELQKGIEIKDYVDRSNKETWADIHKSQPNKLIRTDVRGDIIKKSSYLVDYITKELAILEKHTESEEKIKQRFETLKVILDVTTKATKAYMHLIKNFDAISDYVRAATKERIDHYTKSIEN
jgi:DNA repair exonuclease SbcCD ATPase subunit